MADPKPIPELTKEQEARFWSKVDKRGPDECWEWNRNCARYPKFTIHHTYYISGHRIAFHLANGPFDPLLHILHKCDNMKCCNPNHLFSGTCLDNMQDKARKGRAASGDRNGLRVHPERATMGERNVNAKLRVEDIILVRQFRAEGMELQKIANRFGVSKPCIWNICRKKTWRHVH